MNTNITIEQLAEKMSKTVWSKGEVKRIYLNDAGWNTKKMSTKTFIFQDENGNFVVSCKVDCPSQPYQWCKSQEDEVKERIYNTIENLLAETVYLIQDDESKLFANSSYKYDEFEEIDNCTQNFIKKSDAEKYFSDEIENTLYNYDRKFSIVEMSKKEFSETVNKWWERVEKEQKEKQEKQEKQVFQTMESDVDLSCEIASDRMKEQKKKVKLGVDVTFGIGAKVKHARFGEGEVVNEDDTRIDIKFSEGTKNLLKKFANLQKVEQ